MGPRPPQLDRSSFSSTGGVFTPPNSGEAPAPSSLTNRTRRWAVNLLPESNGFSSVDPPPTASLKRRGLHSRTTPRYVLAFCVAGLMSTAAMSVVLMVSMQDPDLIPQNGGETPLASLFRRWRSRPFIYSAV
jgi:hypothetical protein